MSEKKYDVIVAGSGPAGLAAASHCSRRGLRTACISPDIDERWENNYGVWREEVKTLGLEDAYNHLWERADFIFSEKLTKTFDYAYIQFNGEKLKAKLINDGGKNNLDLIKQKLEKVEHNDTGSKVWSDNGDQYEATVVIDASGFEPVFLNRPGKKADTLQVAYGVAAKVDRHPYPVDRFTMMDFRYEFLKGDDYPPTICYIMPFSNDYIFFEETSIVNRPGVKMEVLQDRLEKRLKSIGVTIKKKDWEEFCYIPTNPPRPDFKQRVIGFGAAAGLIHSNTGYCAALNLNLAPVLADSIYNDLNSGVQPDQLSKNAWGTLWPGWRKRMAIFNRGGMELFNRITIKQLILFLRMFFSFPDKVWQGYLSNNVSFWYIQKEFLKGYGKRLIGNK